MKSQFQLLKLEIILKLKNVSFKKLSIADTFLGERCGLALGGGDGAFCLKDLIERFLGPTGQGLTNFL